MLDKDRLTFLDFVAGCIALKSFKKLRNLLDMSYTLMAGSTIEVLTVQKLFDSVRNSQTGVDWPFVTELRHLSAYAKREMLME